MKNDYKILQNRSARNIDEINNELNLIKNEYDDFRQETDKIIDKLKNEYEHKIKNILEENENKLIIKIKEHSDIINDILLCKFNFPIQHKQEKILISKRKKWIII